MRLRLVVYVLTAAIAGVLVGVPASSAQRLSPSITGHPILSGTLRGSSVYPAIRGGVGFGPFTKTEQDRHFSLSLRNAPGKLTGKLLTVFAAGHKLGFMRVGSQGTAQLVRYQSKGQYVPRLQSGDHVRVRNRFGTTLIASCTLHPRLV